MKYQEHKAKHEKILNDFQHIFFAFDDDQFNKGMIKMGLKPDETNLIYSIGAGGYILKSKSKEFNTMFENSTNEREKLMKDKKFLVNAMDYELGNHEWCVTMETQPALDALGLDFHKLNKMQSDCLTVAVAIQREYAMENVW